MAGWATADSHCPTDPQAEASYGQPSPPADWHGCDLSNVSLTYVNLTGTDLTGANLGNAYLFGASLQFAKIEGVNLAGARFDGGTLRGATGVPANGNATYNGTTCPDGFEAGWGWPPDVPPDTCIGHFIPIDVDGDNDGVADDIGTGISGEFDDRDGTAGSIIDRGGLDVLVEDSIPGGVRITANGATGTTTIFVCGFTLHLSAGSDAIVTCGSISITVAQGEATIVLGDGDSVTIPSGGGAVVDRLPDGTLTIDNFGATPVGLIFNGATREVESGAFGSFPPDSDNDGIADAVDLCAGTVLPDVPTIGLLAGRFAAAGDGSFVSGTLSFNGLYTLKDTRGCSATQIIERNGLGIGHSRFGISHGELKSFIAAVS